MIALALAWVVQGQEPANNTPLHGLEGTKLAPVSLRESIIFYLPDSWAAKFWKSGDVAVKPYVVQLPPHKLDIEEDFAPCQPPPRIAIGYIDATNVTHEKLEACINFCDPRPQNKVFYSGLWGRLTRIEKVEVSLEKDEMLDVKFEFKKLGGPEIRTRHLLLRGPRQSLPVGEAGSCGASE